MRRRPALLGLIFWLGTGCSSPAETAPDASSPRDVAAERAAIPMRVPRAAHMAVALADGRVLLVGGCVEASCEGGPASATVDLFDPRTRRFELAGSLTMRRVSTTAMALPSGKILVAGGWVGSSVSSSVELFDSATGTSRPIGNLSEARADMAAVTLPDGKILLAGGYGGGEAKADIDIFDPRSGTIASAGQLAVPRAGAGAALLPDGRVLIVAGGTSGTGGLIPTAAAEIFDPATGQSSATGSLRDARYKHAVVTLRDGRALVLGGSDARDAGGKLDTVEIFDAATGSFEPAGRMVEPRYKIAGAVVVLPDGRVLIAGGGERSELYDPATGRSRATGPDFGRRLNFASATLLPGDLVLVAGGYDENGIRMNDRAWIVEIAAASPRKK